jgi:hypothetical protein
MKRQVDYIWRLAELMAAAGMHNSTDLIPALPNVASRCHARRCIAWSPTPRTGFAAPDGRVVRHPRLRD